ncbi:hypothetical protein Krad_2474 [Kineococcus radiotolerans SRS30216 = ATCC BAA-149]|uniref:Uncharacterized protein n=1 Tax=Kineococcus radiotolerans (strain ATCC BAA-149 / DSM 14245 / SRS30216) TaxID=266940 RepID=A6WAW1_KINRD|nr:hypothetical protein Krad_2474 [Kineococcus radiotolerans SRS30216 = ATCC BAA-149]
MGIEREELVTHQRLRVKAWRLPGDTHRTRIPLKLIRLAAVRALLRTGLRHLSAPDITREVLAITGTRTKRRP